MSKHATKKISEMQIPKVSSLDLTEFEEWESSIDFSDPRKVEKILIEHFLAGEHDTFFEIIALYIDHIGKTKVSKALGIPQRTIYNFIDGKHKTSSENTFKLMRFVSDQVSRYKVSHQK